MGLQTAVGNLWRKLTATGKPRIGTGYRVGIMHEPILVASPR
jgi:N6-adenosine-specific RNA methylase IME4